MDKLIDLLYQHDLTPGFELMGNPGGYFTDLNNEQEQLFLFQIIKDMKDRYLRR